MFLVKSKTNSVLLYKTYQQILTLIKTTNRLVMDFCHPYWLCNSQIEMRWPPFDASGAVSEVVRTWVLLNILYICPDTKREKKLSVVNIVWNNKDPVFDKGFYLSTGTGCGSLEINSRRCRIARWPLSVFLQLRCTQLNCEIAKIAIWTESLFRVVSAAQC